MSKSLVVWRSLMRPLRLLPTVILMLISVPVIGMAWIEGSKALGLKAVPVPVVGTGSMYPSLFWSKEEGGPEDESKKIIEEYRSTPHLYRRFGGLTLLGRTYFRRFVQFGDMVAFANEATAAILKEENKDENAGFIKRVIGIPGDTIELRDGFVYRNAKLLQEPYTATPRSSYGGSSLAECQILTIPQGHYFVLGDNRKVSSDSRFELGLIQEQDIQYALPLAEQKQYEALWRDTSKDSELLGEPTLQSEEFVRLANTARTELKLPPLSLKPALSKSTTLRGERILQNEDTSFGMKQAVSAAGYSNIVLGEFVSYGHFSAQELLENLLFQGATAKQLLSPDYTDLGLTAVNRVVEGCPRQVIVGHLGGYIPAQYDEAHINSWRALIKNLDSVIPSWVAAQDYEGIDQTKLQELLTILRRRRSLAQEIVDTMQAKEWISDAQEARIKADDTDAQQAEDLAKDLNKQ